MARSPDIDTLSTYYQTLKSEPSKEGEGPPSRVLSALIEPGVLRFDELRQATEIAPVELGDVLRGLQDLDLVKIEKVSGSDEVSITPQGKQLVFKQPD